MIRPALVLLLLLAGCSEAAAAVAFSVPATTSACAFDLPTVPAEGLTPADTGDRQVFDPDSYGGTDAARVQSALNAAAAVGGAVVMHRFYSYVGKAVQISGLGGGGIMITGGGIRRACSPQQTLTQDAVAGDSCIHVANGTAYTVGLATGVFSSVAYNGRICSFTSSSTTATTVCAAAPIGCTASAGATLAYWDSDLISTSPTSNDGIVVDSVAWDGGADCNPQSHDWTMLNTLSVRGANTIQNSYWYNTPSENLTTCGATVSNNTAWDLQGSFDHKSCGAVGPVDVFSDNRVTHTNIATDAVMEHSEGLITFSANAGNDYSYRNRYLHGAEGVWGKGSVEEENVHALYDCYSDFKLLIQEYGGANQYAFSFDAVMEDMPTHPVYLP